MGFWMVLHLLLVALTSAQTCQHAVWQNSSFCGGLVLRDSSIECDPCDVERCCRPVETCEEQASVNPALTDLCGAQYLKVSASNNCAGASCMDSNTCCVEPTSCYELMNINQGSYCSRSNLTLDYSANCEGRCTQAQCCRPPNTCNEFLQIFNLNPCQALGLIPSYTTDLCDNETCDVQTCCRTPQTCSEADMASGYQLGSSCGGLGLTFDGNVACNENGPCDSSVCCVPPRACYQITNPNGYCSSGLAFDYNAGCADVCTPADCCHPPQTCYQVFNIDTEFCSNARMFTNQDNYTLLHETCPTLPCSVERCCREAASCYEAVNYGSDIDCDVGQVFNYSAPCAGAGCDTSTCCRSPTNCRETNEANSNQLSYEWCGKHGLYFDGQVECSDCDASVCCREPTACDEANSYGDFCAFPLIAILDRLDCDGPCTTTQCCRLAERCEDVQYSITCPRGAVLDRFKNCTGSNCNSATCCKQPTTCYELRDAEGRFCYKHGLAFNDTAVCGATGCTTDVCCIPAQNCYDTSAIQDFGLCYNQGSIISASCSGVGCNSSVCCVRPNTCMEIAAATSTHGVYNSRWCARRGFKDSFGTTNCGDECTAAICCATVNTCEDWYNVWQRTRTTTTGGQSGPANVCPIGSIIDRTLTCNDGECNEKTCCRPYATCEDAGFEILCPANTYPLSSTSCSGATCTEETCCAPSTTCAEANRNFFLCTREQMIPNENATEPCTGGVCTAAQCCIPATECDHLMLLQCPANSDKIKQECGHGSFPPCNIETCCAPFKSCRDALSNHADLCDGYGVFNFAIAHQDCGGACDKTRCCRTTPTTCGEADDINNLCDGAVDYFKPCTGAQCNKDYCCRAPVNCREAVASGDVTCAAGSGPTNLHMATCPDGGCTVETCCKPFATCRDANAVTPLCNGANSFLLATTACGSDPVCNEGTCCRAPNTCGEATQDGSFCAGSLVNLETMATVCNGACTKQQCCRGPVSCVEAYLSLPRFCGALEFNLSAATVSCTDCIATCCIEPLTFPPSKAPTPRQDTTTAPTPRQDTTTAPTPKDTAPPSPTNNNNANVTCPREEFSALVAACVNTDFVPAVKCSTRCKTAAEALLNAFANLDRSMAQTCLSQAATIYSADAKAHIVERIRTNIGLCIGTADDAVNSAEMISSSYSFATFLGLLALLSQ